MYFARIVKQENMHRLPYPCYYEKFNGAISLSLYLLQNFYATNVNSKDSELKRGNWVKRPLCIALSDTFIKHYQVSLNVSSE